MNSSSIDEAEATSYGVSGKIKMWNPDTKKSLEDALLAMCEEISAHADGFYGHIKTILRSTDGWVSMNLVDPRLGVHEAGSMPDCPCDFKVMAVALDIDHESLRGIMHTKLASVDGLEVIASINAPILNIED